MHDKAEAPTVLRGAGETGKVHPGDAEHLQSPEQLVNSAAGDGGILHHGTASQRRTGGAYPVPENGRVPSQGGTDLHELQAELLRSSAIREIGRMARAFMKEYPEDYARIYRNLFGDLKFQQQEVTPWQEKNGRRSH